MVEHEIDEKELEGQFHVSLSTVHFTFACLLLGLSLIMRDRAGLAVARLLVYLCIFMSCFRLTVRLTCSQPAVNDLHSYA